MRGDRMRSIPVNSSRSLTTPFKVRSYAPGMSSYDTRHRLAEGKAQSGGALAVRDDRNLDPRAIVHRLDRIEALLQQQIEARETILRVGTLELDLVEHTARRMKRLIELLPREYVLLKYLMEHSGEVVTRNALLKDVWHYTFTPATNRIDVHMSRLRNKIDGTNEVRMIHNVRGAGFILQSEF
jgi:DNA-binding response OmpR family regulator